MAGIKATRRIHSSFYVLENTVILKKKKNQFFIRCVLVILTNPPSPPNRQVTRLLVQGSEYTDTPHLARFWQGTMRWIQGSISWHRRFILSSVLKHQTRAPLFQTIRDGGYCQHRCTAISPLGLWCHTGLVVVHRCLCRIGLLIIPLLWNLACCFLVPWKLVLREKSFMSDAAWIFQGLRPRYMVSSSIGIYLQPLGGNQRQQHHWRFGWNRNPSYM